ncbi:sorting nexin-11 [Cebidichthys violaceus]|uniref:sorting nexin-11 n=1 Tax=Cebidichthys violaceus TaxID=271503 RepID=UPI0035CC7E15
MISNQEEDEFVAVRVQDPRMQNEGSWNSYVDYKIFLHTNSKAFTAKTSCVRRRYSEFAWLKKKLQKNAGLVPVPELPGKSFFFFSNEDFLEKRRKGLQAFLDHVVNMTVCLSDSQLHLFLQTQLPVGHIQDCVQGHTPYSVTDAILTYASSNRGYAQAQEEDSIKEPSLTVSYESMESPAPHQPKEIFSPELLSCDDSNPPEDILEICDEDTVELQHEERSSVRVVQKSDHLEAIVEDCGPTEATFFLGDGRVAPESLGLPEQIQQKSCQVQIQTPVEVHSTMGAGFERNGVDGLLKECSVREESVTTSDTAEKTGPHPEEEKADQWESSGEAKKENVESEPEKCANSAAILDFKDGGFEEQATESDAGSQEEVLEAVCSERQVLETHVISEVKGLGHVDDTEVHEEDASSPEEFKNTDGQKEPDDKKEEESESKAETPLQSGIHEETRDVLSVPEEEGSGDDLVQQVDVVRITGDSDEDGRSSSNDSIVQVSDEESLCDDAEDSIQAANGYTEMPPEEVHHWSPVEASSRDILELHSNGHSVEKEDISAHEDEDLQHITDISDSSKSLDLNLTVTGDLTENSDFSIIESSSIS